MLSDVVDSTWDWRVDFSMCFVNVFFVYSFHFLLCCSYLVPFSRFELGRTKKNDSILFH